MDTLLDAFAAIDRILWGPWTLLFIASVAVYFTVRSGLFQLVRFPYIVRNTFGKILEKPADLGAQRITPFQAAATSLAGTVSSSTVFLALLCFKRIRLAARSCRVTISIPISSPA